MQSRDKLEDKKGKNDKVPTTVWKEYKVERKKEREKKKEASNLKKEKDSEMDNR